MDGPLLSAIDIFYYNYHVSNALVRITLMLDWLMQPLCQVQHLNATKTAETIVTCGGKTNGTIVARASDMIRLGTTLLNT
jgi:hypothetical protein